MTTPYLGMKAVPLDIVLQPNSTFTSGMRRTEGTWEAGDQIQLRFSNGTIWDAVLDGDLASWSEPQAAVNAVIAAQPHGAEVWYLGAGGAEVRWTRGDLKVQS